jgi:hypothetical protein
LCGGDGRRGAIEDSFELFGQAAKDIVGKQAGPGIVSGPDNWSWHMDIGDRAANRSETKQVARVLAERRNDGPAHA